MAANLRCLAGLFAFACLAFWSTTASVAQDAARPFQRVQPGAYLIHEWMAAQHDIVPLIGQCDRCLEQELFVGAGLNSNAGLVGGIVIPASFTTTEKVRCSAKSAGCETACSSQVCDDSAAVCRKQTACQAQTSCQSACSTSAVLACDVTECPQQANCEQKSSCTEKLVCASNAADGQTTACELSTECLTQSNCETKSGCSRATACQTAACETSSCEATTACSVAAKCVTGQATCETSKKALAAKCSQASACDKTGACEKTALQAELSPPACAESAACPQKRSWTALMNRAANFAGARLHLQKALSSVGVGKHAAVAEIAEAPSCDSPCQVDASSCAKSACSTTACSVEKCEARACGADACETKSCAAKTACGTKVCSTPSPEPAISVIELPCPQASVPAGVMEVTHEAPCLSCRRAPRITVTEVETYTEYDDSIDAVAEDLPGYEMPTLAAPTCTPNSLTPDPAHEVAQLMESLGTVAAGSAFDPSTLGGQEGMRKIWADIVRQQMPVVCAQSFQQPTFAPQVGPYPAPPTIPAGYSAWAPTAIPPVAAQFGPMNRGPYLGAGAVDAPHCLRNSAAMLDDVANELEAWSLYDAADELRASAQKLRTEARGMSPAGASFRGEPTLHRPQTARRPGDVAPPVPCFE